jgi:dTMP kinase
MVKLIGWPPMFVTFEGLDGSGKTTQAELLRARWEADGLKVIATREPGGTELGERIRELLLHGGHVAPWAEALLYAAARAQLVDEVIRPAVDRSEWVICDRYVDSSIAYQGAGRGLGFELVLDLNLAAVGRLMPDRTFLLLLDPAEISGRLSGKHDRLESESADFHARVAEGYRELAARFSERIVVLDGTRPAEDIAEEVYGALRVSA